jgi:hypothetical protein
LKNVSNNAGAVYIILISWKYERINIGGTHVKGKELF